MSAHYTIIQYVPDPVAGERVNVGVAAFSNGLVKTRFLVNWQRVKDLWRKDTLDLERLEAIFRGVDESRLIEMTKTWGNSIQFTTPNASIRSLEETVDVAAKRFLLDPELSTSHTRKHSDVVIFAKNSLLDAFTRRFGARTSKDLIKRHIEIEGRIGLKRRFDLAFCKTEPLHVIQALSFAGSKSAERQVHATAYLVEEIKDKVPITIVVAPPSSTASHVDFENARKTFDALAVAMVEEREFPEVAARIANEA